MNLREEIKKNRPHLTESSIKTYVSILKNLHAVCFKDQEMKMSDFNDSKCIMDHLKDMEHKKRKTILAALVVLTGNKHYGETMMEDISKYKTDQLNQKKDGKFAENMIEPTKVEEILKLHERNAKAIYSKKAYSMKDLQEIVNYVLLCLTSGIYQEPRRSKDWDMKFRNFDEKTDNCCDLKKKEFIFNDFKTKSSKGTQRFPIHPELLKILKKWVKIIPSGIDVLLFDNNKNALTPSQITHRLNNIFDKKTSTSMLRHIFLTKKFGNVNLKEIVDTADKMGNSLQTALEYVKR